MTEFKRVTAEVEEMGSQLAALDALPAPEAQAQLSALQDRLTGPLGEAMSRFSKRLTECDPITGQLRYGEGMRAKVAALQERYNAIMATDLPAAAERVAAALAAHSATAAEDSRAAAAAAASAAAARLAAERQSQADAAAAAAAAAARESADAARRAALAEEAEEARRRRREEEEATAAAAAAARAAREAEAAELSAAAPVGAAGVEAGLRTLAQQCAAAGGTAQAKVTHGALLQILQNVRSNPEDPRFRRIRTENERFHADVGRFEGAIQVLLSSGFKLVVEDETTFLLMSEPDLATDADGWTLWYDTLKGTIERLREATNARDATSHGGLMH